MKRIVALFLCLILLFSFELPVSAISAYQLVANTQQTDIQMTDWFAGAVYSLRNAGIYLWDNSRSFHPTEEVSLNEVINALSQVTNNSESYIRTKIEGNMLSASSKMSDHAITREELAFLTYQYSQQEHLNVTYNQYIENYTDGYLVSDYAKDAMNWAISAGYIRGGSNRCLMPKSIVTRAQFSVFLYRYSRDLLCNTRQDYSKDYGIRFEYPSDRQSIIEYGRDFYVIADFIGHVEISEYDRVEVNVISHKTWKTLRTVYTEKKCDYDNLNVNYEGLTVLSDGGNREAFRAAGMPDLVYDRSNPETFADTWIKCFYDDNRIAATIFSSEYTQDINPYDQYGQKIEPLPRGKYTVRVIVESGISSRVIAHAEKVIEIGTYPQKIASPFMPDEHFNNLKSICAAESYEIFIDPFPGYWNWTFINPDWGDDFCGMINTKWKYMDATEYNSGTIHFYIYDVGIDSTAYNLEIGQVESAGSIDRVISHCYDIGEPHIGNASGTFIQIDISESPVIFNRAEFLTSANTLGDGQVDMRTLDTVRFQRLTSTQGIVCNVGQVIALYGTCAPIMSTGEIVMNPDTGDYNLNNMVDRIEYFLSNKQDGTVATYSKQVDLTRKFATVNLESETSGFEFKHDFTIPDTWRGDTIQIEYSAYDSFGNAIVENLSGPIIYVTK